MHKKSSEKGRREERGEREREREGLEGREGEGERRGGGGGLKKEEAENKGKTQTLIKPPNLWVFFFLGLLSSLPALLLGSLNPGMNGIRNSNSSSIS